MTSIRNYKTGITFEGSKSRKSNNQSIKPKQEMNTMNNLVRQKDGYRRDETERRLRLGLGWHCHNPQERETKPCFLIQLFHTLMGQE